MKFSIFIGVVYNENDVELWLDLGIMEDVVFSLVYLDLRLFR